MPTKIAAVVTLRGAVNFTPAGKRRIVAWLRRQARFLDKHAGELAPTFQARYRYRNEVKRESR